MAQSMRIGLTRAVIVRLGVTADKERADIASVLRQIKWSEFGSVDNLARSQDEFQASV